MDKINQQTFRLTKKIAKHGNQAIIVIPKALQSELSPNTIVDINISIIKKPYNENELFEIDN